MVWWQWMVLGAILLIAELVGIDAQFYLIFLGLSALLVGLLGLFGIEMALWMQWVAFSVFAIISLVVFRRWLYENIRGTAEGFRESLAGESINVGEELAAGAETRIEYRGTKWTARNTGEGAIPAGSRAKVVKVEGLTLHIETE